MTRNFLEGARKQRMSYKPTGLYRAWKNLDAASKVYMLTLMGLIMSVSCFSYRVYESDANFQSSPLLLSFTLARVGSTLPTVSLELWLDSWSAAKDSNGAQEMYLQVDQSLMS